MWPPPRAPISTTPASVPSGALASVSGTPSSLLNERSLAAGPIGRARAPARGGPWSTSCRRCPVMPTTRSASRVRAWRPRSSSAARRVVDPHRGRGRDRAGGRGRPPHPPAIAASMKSWPSRSATIGTNSSPPADAPAVDRDSARRSCRARTARRRPPLRPPDARISTAGDPERHSRSSRGVGVPTLGPMSSGRPRAGRPASAWSCCSAACRPSTTCRASRPRTCCGPSTGERYDVVPIGITRDGQWVAADDAMAAARGRRSACAARLARDGRSRRRADADAGADRRRRADRRPSPAPRAARRGRHRAGAARAGRRGLRRRGRARVGAVHGQGDGQDRPRRGGHPAGRGTSRLATSTSTTRSSTRVVDELGLPVVREAGEPRLVGRHHPCRRRTTRFEHAVADALALRRVGRHRGSGRRRARSRSACSATPRRVCRCRARSCRATSSTTTTTSTSTARRGWSSPPTSPTEVADEIARLAVEAYTVRCAATAWHGSTSSTRRTAAACCSTSSNTIPGFTPWSMYPSLWEASGVPLPRADRRARPPRPRTPRAP